MAGSRLTSETFDLLRDLALQNQIITAAGVPTDDVIVGTAGPNLDLPAPPGVESGFTVWRAGAPFAAITVTPIPPRNFQVTIPTGAGALERIHYAGAPIWGNASGGQVLAFDVPLPFP